MFEGVGLEISLKVTAMSKGLHCTSVVTKVSRHVFPHVLLCDVSHVWGQLMYKDPVAWRQSV